MSKLNCMWVSLQRWGIGVTKEYPEYPINQKWFEGYSHPLIANFLKGYCDEDEVWKYDLCEVRLAGKVNESPEGFSATKVTLVRDLPYPKITFVNKAAFGILCGMKACKDPKFIRWAEDWLNGNNRDQGCACDIQEYMHEKTLKHDELKGEIYYGYRSGLNAVKYAIYSQSAVAASYPHQDTSMTNDLVAHAVNYCLSINKNVDLISLAEKAMEVK